MLVYFAHPLRALNDIFDPSKATSARPRKLGLRPQTVRVRPVGRFLSPRRVPKNIACAQRLRVVTRVQGVMAAQGTCGVGVKSRLCCVTPIRKFRRATESEG